MKNQRERERAFQEERTERHRGRYEDPGGRITETCPNEAENQSQWI